MTHSSHSILGLRSSNHQHDESGSHEDRKDRKTELPASEFQNQQPLEFKSTEMIHSESRNTSTSEEAFWNHNWWRGNVSTARIWTLVQIWTFWFHLQKRWITFVTSTVKHGGEPVMMWRRFGLQTPDNLLQTINIEILTNAASQRFDHPLASAVCYCTLRYETYSIFLCKTRFAKITFLKET